MSSATQTSLLQNLKKGNAGIPVLVVLILAMVVLPLPPFLLDVLFTFNIALSLIVLLACVYSRSPLDFSVFPTVLLVTTLLRLALNIASTRVVLLHGHTGPGAAGQVIKSFGEVVIGGNYTVGIVVFAILVIINFVVVTKGAGRISEVSARFTLDAMPGKQMAIDADLNSGLITQEAAKTRRREVAEEADFYGAMDGASKFVRGDALAGLLILFINVIGGFAIGVSQYAMSMSSAAQTYSLLTIGDGLAAQVPSLLLSTAAAIMVTRVSSEHDMGTQITQQLMSNPRVLAITAIVIGCLGLIPGMPHVAFLVLAAFAGYAAFHTQQKNQQRSTETAAAIEADPTSPEIDRDLDWNDIEAIDTIKLEIGYRLINLVDNDRGGKLMQKIKSIRRKLSTELGFLIPAIRIKDNLNLKPNEYRLSLLGVVVGHETVHIDKELAINPGQAYGSLEGIPCKDPTFGLNAIWIDANQKDQAQSLGYTVVDPCTVIGTHLSHILQSHSAQILGHEETQNLLNKLAEKAPKLAEALVPNALQLNVVVKVLQRLLIENIPIIDIRTIAEALIEHAAKNADPDYLTAMVRVALKQLIVQNICGDSPRFSAATLAPELEQLLQQSLQLTPDQNISLEPGLAEKLHASLVEFDQKQAAVGESVILLVSPNIRSHLAKLFRSSIPGLNVMSYQELPDNKEVNIVGSIGA